MNNIFKILHRTNRREEEIIIADNKKIKQQKNLASIFSFNLYAEDNSFYSIKKYSSYIKVINQFNNEIIFQGRVISVSKNMNENDINATIQVESELNYLNDVIFLEKIDFYPTTILPEQAQENSKLSQTVTSFLEYLLKYYNSRVTIDKEIRLGIIEDDASVYIKVTEQATILNLIQSKIVAKKNGYLQIRTENNIRYLDFLATSPVKKTLNIELGLNQKSISIDDNFNFYTRIIPIGKDDIDIASVNNNINYIQNDELVSKYGVLEKIMKWDDVTIPQNLFNKAKKAYNELCLGLDNIKLQALDLSYLNNNLEELKLYRPIRAINNILGYDKIHEIVSIDFDLDNIFESTFDLNINEVSANNNINSVIEQSNKNTLEIVNLGNEIITKVSSDKFETYREQSDKKIQETVKDINNNIESTRTQLSNAIEDKVSEGNLETIVKQNAKSWGLSISGELESKNYKFDENGFWITGKNGGCELTDTFAKWTDNQGNTFEVGANGFKQSSQGVSGNIKYYDFITRRAGCKNGYVEYIQLPNNFKNKELDKDFSIYTLWDGIDSNLDAKFKKDALRNIFIKIVNWNSEKGVLAIQPCIQKIGLETNTFFGWDENSTTPGNPIGEGSMDIILICTM